MLIRVCSLEYGKYLWEQGCVALFWQKVSLSIWIYTLRIWPLEAAIMQAKG